jgi:hypothetical protein
MGKGILPQQCFCRMQRQSAVRYVQRYSLSAAPTQIQCRIGAPRFLCLLFPLPEIQIYCGISFNLFSHVSHSQKSLGAPAPRTATLETWNGWPDGRFQCLFPPPTRLQAQTNWLSTGLARSSRVIEDLQRLRHGRKARKYTGVVTVSWSAAPDSALFSCNALLPLGVSIFIGSFRRPVCAVNRFVYAPAELSHQLIFPTAEHSSSIRGRTIMRNIHTRFSITQTGLSSSKNMW